MPDEELMKLKKELGLLNVQEISFITNWSNSTILKLMDEDEELPAIKIGKENQVTFDALKEYLQHRRIKRGKED